MTEEKLLEQAKALAKPLGYISGRLIIARALGVGQNSARRITRLLKNSNIDYNGKPSSVDKPRVVSFESAKDKDGNQIHQATIRSNQRFHSVEELAEYCDIDLNIWDAVKVVANEWNRSEERRVGKECRSRWSRYYENREK